MHPLSGVTQLDAEKALRTEQAAEDEPPRRPEALWPQVAQRSDPRDVPGTDPDHVDQAAAEPRA